MVVGSEFCPKAIGLIVFLDDVVVFPDAERLPR
jgi:hypothetical protein